MEVSPVALSSINDGVQLAYRDAFLAYSADSVYSQFAQVVPSSHRTEKYPQATLIPGMREWVGDRVVHQLSEQSFEIPNLMFENTISVARTDIEDDEFGILSTGAQQLAENAAHLPDLRLAKLLKSGNSIQTYDNQNFFDTSHPQLDGSGVVSNYQAGTGLPWFLLSTKRVWKPLIWQTRRPFQVIPNFSPTSPNVFWQKEFIWGVDGRANGGFGLWQLAAMSKSPLNVDNILYLMDQAATIRRPDGTPMGITFDTLMVPNQSMMSDAKSIAENDSIVAALSRGSPTVAVGGANFAANTMKGAFKPLLNTFLA